MVYDGLGNKPLQADVLLENGRIAGIGILPELADACIIDSCGMAVTPGFVDMHRHCDIAPMRDSGFGTLELAQGITTAIAGNCGLAPVPISQNARTQRETLDFLEPVTGKADAGFSTYASYFAALEAVNLPLNIGILAGAGAIKTAIKGFTDTPYTESELALAAQFVREAMDTGAFGVSLGIMYQPEYYSTEAELAKVVAPAAKAGGVLTAHIRGEGDSLVESVGEVLEVARRAGMRAHISHFKSTGIANWNNKIYKAIECIEAARAAGMDVTADFYPYDGGATTLLSLIPPSVPATGQTLLQRLSTAQGKEMLRRDITKTHTGWDNMALSIGWDRIVISGTSLPEHERYNGRSVAALADENSYEYPSDFVCDLLVSEQGRVGIIVLSMHQQDIDAVARLPYTAVISDALYGGGANPHPRVYGSFPKVLREYVIQRGILTFEEAIRKMTSLPAKILGLKDRGVLRIGAVADINVFNPQALRDHADYTAPKQYATGMEWVFVAGQPAWYAQSVQSSRNASVLRRTAQCDFRY